MAKHSAALTGAGITKVDFDLGTTAQPNRYLNTLNVNEIAADNKKRYSTVGEINSETAVHNVKARISTTGANVDALDAGSITVSLKIAKAII